MRRVLALKGRAPGAAALFLTAALLNLSALAPRAASRVAPHAGEVTMANGVSVEGSPAVQGQTFFSGSRLASARNSESLLSLDNLGRVGLSEEAALRLDFDGAIVGGALEAGRVRVYAPRGVAADFSTADARMRSDPREAVSFGLLARSGFTEISVQSGALEVSAGGASRILRAGESYSTAPEPQSQQNLSGRKRVGLIAAIATAVAIVAIVLTARGGQTPDPICEGVPIVPSGDTPILFPCR